MLLTIPAIPNATAADCALTRITEMPLTPDADGSPIVTILVGDHPRSMLLDTGGYWSVISPWVTESYPIDWADQPIQLGLNGIPLTTVAHVPSVQLGIMKFGRADFYVAPTGYLKMDGTLGANWLQAFDVEIDPVKNSASLFSPKHCPGQVVYWPHTEMAEIPVDLSRGNHHLSLSLLLDGQEFKAVIDTGAPETVISSRAAEHMFQLTGKSAGMQLLESGKDRYGETLEVYRHQFRSLKIGDIAFNHPWLVVAPMTIPGVDIILGMHHLRALHLYFAYDERKLYVTSARGDIAAQQAVGGNGGARTAMVPHAPDPLDRMNAKDNLDEAAVALKKVIPSAPPRPSMLH